VGIIVSLTGSSTRERDRERDLVFWAGGLDIMIV
jgi:hypothetical protein